MHRTCRVASLLSFVVLATMHLLRYLWRRCSKLDENGEDGGDDADSAPRDEAAGGVFLDEEDMDL